MNHRVIRVAVTTAGAALMLLTASGYAAQAATGSAHIHTPAWHGCL